MVSRDLYQEAALEDIAGFLSGVPVFAPLEQDTLEAVADTGRPRTLASNELLFHAGDPFWGLFVVMEGHVQLSEIRPNGHEQVLVIVGAGAPFAEEVAFLPYRRYPAEARALERTRLFEIPAEPFDHLLDQRPTLARSLLYGLSRRLQYMAQNVTSLTLDNATERVAGFLETLALESNPPKTVLQLPAKKGTVANRLGLKPETFSRILTCLRAQGVIGVEGGRVRLLDLEGLRNLRGETPWKGPRTRSLPASQPVMPNS